MTGAAPILFFIKDSRDRTVSFTDNSARVSALPSGSDSARRAIAVWRPAVAAALQTFPHPGAQPRRAVAVCAGGSGAHLYQIRSAAFHAPRPGSRCHSARTQLPAGPGRTL